MDSKSVKELKSICRELNIHGYSKLRKKELVELITTTLNEPNSTNLIETLQKKKNINYTKPLLKWIGGKTNIINKIIDKFPTKINNYYEPFIGGGSVLFALLDCIKNKKIKLTGKIYACDLNEPLIFFYKNVQNHPDELYTSVQRLVDKYNNKKTNSKKEKYYYHIRNKYNKMNDEEKKSILGSSIFLFLNKVGFRGLYRMSKDGNFNVPFGHYKNITENILNYDHLIYVSKLIENVHFRAYDFEEINFKQLQNDFVYFDPPYVNTYKSYTSNGFDKHKKLFKLCATLPKFLLSNSDDKLVYEYIDKYMKSKKKHNQKIKTDKFKSRRAISPNPATCMGELLIYNY